MARSVNLYLLCTFEASAIISGSSFAVTSFKAGNEFATRTTCRIHISLLHHDKFLSIITKSYDNKIVRKWAVIRSVSGPWLFQKEGQTAKIISFTSLRLLVVTDKLFKKYGLLVDANERKHKCDLYISMQ
jgi:hypothetical protein